MRVYLVRYDGGERIVQASSFSSCVSVWRDAMKSEWGDDWQPDDEPESVQLISDEAVVLQAAIDGSNWSETVSQLRDLASGQIDDPPSTLSPLGARMILIAIGGREEISK